MSKGRIIVVSGPSGSGKGSIIKPALSRDKKLFYSISATTRKPRQEDAEGVTYYFYTKEQFEQAIFRDKMLEYAMYADNYYGTPVEKVEQKLNQGYDVVLEIDLQGAMQIKEKYPSAITIFFMPPSLEILKERLKMRGTETDEEIEKRIQIAKREIENAQFYDHVILNEDLPAAIEEFLHVLRKTRKETNMLKPSATEILRDKQSIYSLVMAVAKRARDIADEADEQKIPIAGKPVKMAVEEFAKGEYVFYELDR